jgi:hypothetical protein
MAKTPAEKIADLIRKTSTDNRGDLFREIAVALKTNGQAYTAKGFDVLAVVYEKGFC